MKNTAWTIIVFVLIVAIGGAYWYRTQIARPLEFPEMSTGSALELIERLGRIKIDTSLFQDPRFTELEPFPTPSLEGVQKGKLNPFSLSVVTQ